jgi:hypothetical protein
VGTYRLFDNVPNSDGWFAPEFLRVGEHEYFAAVNGNSIEIREMVWTSVATFTLTTPSVVGVADEGRREEGPRIVARGGGEGGAAMKFGVVLPWGMKADLDVYDVVGRRIRTLNAGALPGGETVVSWDKRDAAGREVGAGMYFVKLETPLGSRSARALVLR